VENIQSQSRYSNKRSS